MPLAFERDLAHRKLHWEGAAVLSLADDDASDADNLSLSGSQIAIQITVMLMTVRCRHQHADIAALHLADGESEEALRSCAKGLDCPSLVDDHHRVRDSVKNGAQVGMADREFLVCNTKLACGPLISKKECAHCRA